MKRPVKFTGLALASFCLVFILGCGAHHDAADSSASEFIGDPELEFAALKVLTNKCSACHDIIASGGVSNITDVNHLINSGLIVPGDPTQGRIMGSINEGTMPQGGSISAAEIQDLEDWILSL